MPQVDLEWLLADLAGRQKRLQLYRDYYDGEHRLLFASDNFKNAFGDLFQAFADNCCPAVVDSLTDRLQLTHFAGGQGEAANRLWEACKMPRRHGEVHLAACRSADAYVIVWPDTAGRPRIYPQEPANVTVLYDDDEPDMIVRAGKLWKANDGRWRATLYYPERNERYVTREKRADRPDRAALFVPLEDDELGPEVPNLWGRPPVFHFGNDAEVGSFGKSELRNVIPLQDALNKAIADMLVAMEFVALPQRYGIGVENQVDPITGQERPPKFGPDRFLTVPAPDAQFGQFEGADLSQFLNVQDAFRVEIARVSGRPLHYFQLAGGNPPSGLSLKVLEGRLNKTAYDRQAAFGDTWEEATAFALRIERGTIEAPDLEAVWVPPETRDELAEVTVQEGKQRVGVSRRRSLRELGYTDDEIDVMDEERSHEQASLGAGLLAAFDRNQPVAGGQADVLAGAG